MNCFNVSDVAQGGDFLRCTRLQADRADLPYLSLLRFDGAVAPALYYLLAMRARRENRDRFCVRRLIVVKVGIVVLVVSVVWREVDARLGCGWR